MQLAYATTYGHLIHSFIHLIHLHSFIFLIHFGHHNITYNVAKMANMQIMLAMAVAVLCKRSKQWRVQEVRENK